MKSSISKICAFFLIAVYCFAIAAVSNPYAISENNISKASLEQLSFDFSTKLFSHTSQAKISLSIFNKLSTPNWKNLILEIGILKSASQLILDAEFSRYVIISRCILIHQRKSDLIFPFHYFW